MNMPALASSPRMVGRDGELETLLDAFADGAAGHPRTVIVRGEAGIGKTRLIQEFLAEATARRGDVPVVVAVGQCVDRGPIGAPFGPVRRVLRDLHACVGSAALRAAAGSTAALASLAALVPDIAEDGQLADQAPGEFAEAIELVLERLSRERHLIVVIEDLQWADASTMALLKTLASALRGRHLTMVATYRSDDIDRFHPLRPVLAELDRMRAIVRVDLEPLSAEEVAEQVAQLAPHLDQRRLPALADRSGGIPFLVEELVDLGDASLPDSLRELVLARYLRVGDAAQETVRVMAAGGMHTDHDVLAAVSSLDDHALDLALREAIDARVVLAEGAGYTFRHALTQEAVHAEMLPSERVRVHRRYAEHLAAHRADAPEDASAIAEHWLAARDLTAAFDATVVALERSRGAGYSPATSVKLIERLTELWHQVPDAAARSGTTLPRLHLDATLAWHDLGDAERALRSANEGLAEDPEDALTRAALLRQRFVQVFNTEHRGRREDLDEAIALLEGSEDPNALALLSRIHSNLAIDAHGPFAAEHAARAIAIAEKARDDPALAVALTVESWRRDEDEDDEPSALEPLERAMSLTLELPVRAYAGAAYVDLLSRLGRYDEAALVGERLYADAVRAGMERGPGTSVALPLAHALFAAGRPDAAVRYAGRARRFGERMSRASVARMLAAHSAWADHPGGYEDAVAAEQEAIDALEHAEQGKRGWWTTDRHAPRAIDPAAAWRPDERAAALQSLIDILDGTAPPVLRRQATVAAATLVDEGTDAAIRRRLAAETSSWPERGCVPVVAGFVRAWLADDHVDPAGRVARWRDVVEALGDGGMPVWYRHLARCQLAAALIADGRREEGASILDRVAAEAPEQGAALVARRARWMADRAGISAGSAPSLPAPDATPLAALTPRELQVLELVAEGLTNPQIGRRLFISPKTASVHVSAILAKIGATNRAEAAALYTAALTS
jgi:DNA-binding CsgD family transcriptional regulator/tetratricopeptide (TPR) repeat protein